MTWNEEGQILQVLLALAATVMIRAILVLPAEPPLLVRSLKPRYI